MSPAEHGNRLYQRHIHDFQINQDFDNNFINKDGPIIKNIVYDPLAGKALFFMTTMRNFNRSDKVLEISEGSVS